MSGKDVLRRKLSFFFKFRGYSVEEESEKENFKDIVVVKKGTNEKRLIRIVKRTPLKSGSVGVHYVRKMKTKIDKEGYEGGILIGGRFSYSASKEAKNNLIEAIPEGSLPAFDIFKHELVPKHEILPNEEAERVLKRYHIKPYKLPQIKASDPVAMLIGAKPGDTLRITRKSPTAGHHVTYRYVV